MTAVDVLNEEQGQLLMLFYPSADYLQRQYPEDLRRMVGDNWGWLPNCYSPELDILPSLSPKEAIHQLGAKYQVLSHTMTNWAGRYKNAALHLIEYKQREQQWSQSRPKLAPNS